MESAVLVLALTPFRVQYLPNSPLIRICPSLRVITLQVHCFKCRVGDVKVQEVPSDFSVWKGLCGASGGLLARITCVVPLSLKKSQVLLGNRCTQVSRAQHRKALRVPFQFLSAQQGDLAMYVTLALPAVPAVSSNQGKMATDGSSPDSDSCTAC